MVSGSKDRSVKVWSLSTGACLRTITHHKNTVFCVKVQPMQMSQKPSHPYEKFMGTEVDSDDSDEDEAVDRGTNTTALGDLQATLQKIGKSNKKIASKTWSAAKKALTRTDKKDLDYVVEAAVVACDKDGNLKMTSINTGGVLYSWGHHDKACTCLDVYVYC